MNELIAPNLAVGLLLVLITTATSIYAETVYVSGTLRVGVRPVPDSSTMPISVVTTGAKLQVLERKSGFVKIITEDGISGWVKEIYVTTEVPTRQQLESLRAEHKLQSQKAEALKETIEAVKHKNKIFGEEIETLKSENADLKHQIIRIKESERMGRKKNNNTLWIIIISISLLVMFTLGIIWHRHWVSKRLGGLKV